AAQGQHVAVVILPGEPCRDRLAAAGGPHAWDLVGGDGHADARAADEDAAVRTALGHRPAHRRGEVGVVARRPVVGAQVVDLVPLLGQGGPQVLLQVETRMVGTDGDAHPITSLPGRASGPAAGAAGFRSRPGWPGNGPRRRRWGLRRPAPAARPARPGSRSFPRPAGRRPPADPAALWSWSGPGRPRPGRPPGAAAPGGRPGRCPFGPGRRPPPAWPAPLPGRRFPPTAPPGPAPLPRPGPAARPPPWGCGRCCRCRPAAPVAARARRLPPRRGSP